MEPISAIASLVQSVVSRIWPDKSQADRQKFVLEVTRELKQSEILQKYLEADIKQTETNTAQAQHDSLFVAGPRPFIMWGLGGILVLYFLLSTGISFAIAIGYQVVPMPPLDPMLRDIILGLLGLGYITRSYEKYKSSR